ncbi:MAG: hypothetical protein QXT51_05090 [Nitrososphaerota archaeon]
MMSSGNVLKNMITVVVILALLFSVNRPYVLAQENDSSENIPLGLELSAQIRELTLQHRYHVMQHIADVRTIVKKSQEERFQILNAYHEELKQKLESLLEDRLRLVESLRSGNITPKEFTLEIRRLNTEIYGLGRFAEKLGWKLGEVGKNLSQELREKSIEIVEMNRLFSEEMKNLHIHLQTELMIGKYFMDIENLTDCEKLQLILEKLNEAKSRLTTLKENLQNKYEEIQNQIQSLKESIESKSQNCEECLKLIANLTTKLDILDKEIQKMNTTLGNKKGYLEKFEETLKKLKEEEAGLEKRRGDIEDKIKGLEEEKRQLEKGGVRARERLQEISKLLDNLSIEKKACHEAMNRVRERIENHLKEMMKVMNETHQLMEKIRERIRERLELYKKLEELKDKCRGECKDVVKDYFKQQLLEKKLKFLDIEIQGIDKRIEIISKLIDKINEKCPQLTSQTV